MTEYETATLAIQQASLALQQASITAAYVQAAIAGLVGLIQAGIVGWGIRCVARMGERREQQHADRHEETGQTFPSSQRRVMPVV